jgi:hypothetical protein
MTADPYQQPRRPLDWIRETTEQLGDRPAFSDPLARVHDSQTTQGGAPG